jgi:hypothetical protein
MTYDGYDQEHVGLFDIESSDRAYEEEVLFTGFAAAPDKDEGSTVDYDTATESWVSRYNHTTVALAFAITEEAMEDNLYERLTVRLTKALAKSMAHTKQTKGANIFNNAFSSSFKGGDGVSLSNSSHPLVDGGTISNTASVDLAEASLEDALITIAGWTDDRGIPIALQARKMAIPRNLCFVAERLLAPRGIDMRNATANREISAILSKGMLPEGYVLNHRFTDTDAWFLLTDADDGLKMFERITYQTKFEGDFETGNMRYKARERYVFGWSDWRRVWASDGA